MTLEKLVTHCSSTLPSYHLQNLIAIEVEHRGNGLSKIYVQWTKPHIMTNPLLRPRTMECFCYSPDNYYIACSPAIINCPILFPLYHYAKSG